MIDPCNRFTSRGHDAAGSIAVGKATEIDTGVSMGEVPVTIRYVPSAEFSEPNAAARILSAITLPAAGELLSADQERRVFRAMNFLKHQAAEADAAGHFEQVAANLERAQTLRSAIVEANLGLVWSVVRRYVRRPDQVPDAVADGNLSLLLAVDAFDYTKGVRFSSFGYEAIRRRVWRSQHRKATDARTRLTDDEILQAVADPRDVEGKSETANEWAVVSELLTALWPREREILTVRYGLDGEEPLTTDEAGRRFGVSGSRIQQLERRAIERIRELIEVRRLKV